MRRDKKPDAGERGVERLESEKRALDGTMIIAESRFSSPIPALSRRPHPLLKCWCRRPGSGDWGKAPGRSREFCAGGLPGVPHPPGRGRYFFLRSVLSAMYSLVWALLLRAERNYFRILPPGSPPPHRFDGMQSVFVNPPADMSTHSPARRQ